MIKNLTIFILEAPWDMTMMTLFTWSKDIQTGDKASLKSYVTNEIHLSTVIFSKIPCKDMPKCLETRISLLLLEN